MVCSFALDQTRLSKSGERRSRQSITPSPRLQVMEHAERMRLVGWKVNEEARTCMHRMPVSRKHGPRWIGTDFKHRTSTKPQRPLDPESFALVNGTPNRRTIARRRLDRVNARRDFSTCCAGQAAHFHACRAVLHGQLPRRALESRHHVAVHGSHPKLGRLPLGEIPDRS